MHNFLGLWEDDGRVGLGVLELSGETRRACYFNYVISYFYDKFIQPDLERVYF